jgi:sigma-E factor negative regulatory protein RseC
MLQTGTVKKILDSEAIVEVKRDSACKHCPVHKICFPDDCDTMDVTALNEIGAQEGQKVKIYLKPSILLRYSFIVYIVPLIIMFIGLFLGSFLYDKVDLSLDKEVVQIAGAVIGLVIGFVGIRLYHNKVKDRRSFKVGIVEIIS